MFWIEFAMLLWLVFCAEIMLALENLYGDLWLYSRDNQFADAFVLMLSLGVSRYAGRIGKNYGNANTMNACGIGICNVFEACRCGGDGDLRFTKNPEQTKKQVVLRV